MCFVHSYRFGKQHANSDKKWHKSRFSAQEVKMLGLLPHHTCGQTSPHCAEFQVCSTENKKKKKRLL
ncbi:hypothetical protein CsSME_00011726 [Camellia sinensis var. sinensis]